MVLLVDSERAILRSFHRMARLLPRPLRLRTAPSAEEALALIARDGPPALLITAFHMAGMDGLSLLTQVRVDHPRVRLVLSTGMPAGTRVGPDIALLPKPVEAEGFARLVGSL